MSDARTPAQIEADIARRRQELAVTLDEIGVRVHPKTIIGDAKAKAASAVDRTAGRAYVSANRVVTSVRSQLVSEEGEPRLERIVPVALVAVGLVGLLALSVRSSRASRAARSSSRCAKGCRS
ncbi:MULTISPECIES: DUF3618 domain-containing protein [Streptomyces]|uniref:DUF3618 domain-containing protein n=2 Tax=Streptomyces TaxID=1883 RepID=A0ABT9KQC3_9ACTN|nr:MULTISPECIES: DUF3618 domain-containing protein [Streptomyces]MBW8092837.1 DUF3618 domain-containing protein [Streptomyces hygroscopicus subsp. hygroscopicus]MCO8303874.1 DUF3618 domain-containing protein [Streptomyces sp. RKCA744]MDP9609727.1 hypothetical protein [Streptomyces demainii]GHJ27970.1 hypothetical protein TPA0910_24030 [Streptomyces hygroscopicus]